VATDTNILFILKRREDYNDIVHNPKGLSTGLFNSASFMVDMLNKAGVTANIEVAIDNNCIDRLVTKYKPTHVVIEALWVVPSKFAVLTALHPTVKWVVRLHSEMPFMAGEGMAMDWIADYLSYPQISVGVNAPRMLDEIRAYARIKYSWAKQETNNRVVYLPNYYPQSYWSVKGIVRKLDTVDVGCFGAIRLLKNHLLQAYGALKFAESVNKKLRFHINIGRNEMKGEPVFHNLKAMFMQLAGTGHELVMHEWTPREQFLELCRNMDVGMQCNFSETFNIVGADLISQGVPLVATKEVPWASCLFNADPNSSDSISKALRNSYYLPGLNVRINQHNLTKYTNKTEKIWIKYFKQNVETPHSTSS
jgi:hypothetical protein